VEIPSPTLPPNHEDRNEECAIVMENAVAGLWEFFEEAGWTEDEFVLALVAEARRNVDEE